DVFIILDGAWRIFNGQIPSTDFTNPIGPLVYWLTALGMHVAGPSLKAYVYGNLALLLVLAPWGAWIFFKKLPGPHAFLVTLFIAVLITAPHPLGISPEITTYAMIYNRCGWALSALLFVQMLLPDRHTSRHSALSDSISGGLLLGLTFFCK